MAHSFPSYLGLGYLYSAAVADDTLVSDSLILTAVAFPVLHRSEDFFAEKSVLFRLKSPVVDSLRLGYLAMGPLKNLFRRCQIDLYRFEII